VIIATTSLDIGCELKRLGESETRQRVLCLPIGYETRVKQSHTEKVMFSEIE
jgi:hypothetical protein